MDYLLLRGSETVLVLAVALVPAAILWAVPTARRSGSRIARASGALRRRRRRLLLSIALIGVVGLRPGRGLPGGFEQWNRCRSGTWRAPSTGGPGASNRPSRAWPSTSPSSLPWGLFFALRFARTRWWSFLALTLATSTAIELWQAFNATGRSSDVTDIITNTAGGLVGYAVARGLQRAYAWVARLTPPVAEQHPSGNSTEAPSP